MTNWNPPSSGVPRAAAQTVGQRVQIRPEIAAVTVDRATDLGEEIRCRRDPGAVDPVGSSCDSDLAEGLVVVIGVVEIRRVAAGDDATRPAVPQTGVGTVYSR